MYSIDTGLLITRLCHFIPGSPVLCHAGSLRSRGVRGWLPRCTSGLACSSRCVRRPRDPPPGGDHHGGDHRGGGHHYWSQWPLSRCFQSRGA